MSRIIRRVHQAGVYFVTTDTWQRRQLFLKPDPAKIVLEELLECREREFHKLHAFVIMPEHLHLLLTPGPETTLEKAIQMIKGGSAYRIKKALLYKWPVGHSGYHDRWIRDAQEFAARKRYIEQNPVAAKIVPTPGEYGLSSAAGGVVLDRS